MIQRRQNMLALALLLLLLGLNPTAAGQKIKLSSTSLNFGNQAVGVSSSALGVVLTNTDNITPLAISGVTVSGDYTQSNNCNGLVDPTGTCTLSITFKPNATGTLAGVVTLSDDATDSPQLITIAGTGVGVVGAAPASLAFGTVAVGSSSSSKTVTLTNNLKQTVTMNISASGDYTAAGSGASPCPLSGNLGATKSCTLAVTFKPTFSGSISGALTITQNVTPTPQIVTLWGTGSGGATPPLTFNPASLSFPNTGLGVTSSTAVTITNQSASSLTISAFSASADFVASGGSTSPCGGALGAGKQCSIAVKFTPTIVGVIHGALTITTTGSVKTQVVNLSGTGIVPVTVSPASLTFASQQQGTGSATQTVTLTNHLATTLSITSIAVSGDYARTSGTGTACGSSLAASASCTIGVSFRPLARAGTIPGMLTVKFNATSSPLIVPLSGSAHGNLPRFAFVVNANDNTLSTYTVNYSTGQLRHNGYALTGSAPVSVALHPSGKFVYVVNTGDDTISGYVVGSAGQPTPLPGLPFSTGTAPASIAITPSGQFAYVPNSLDNTVSAYAINAGTGALSAVSGSPFSAGTGPFGITIDPSGKFAYVVNFFDDTVSAYAINTSTGALKAVSGSPFPTGQNPFSVVTDPGGKFAFVPNQGSSTVSAYQINPSTGALTALGSYNTGANPNWAVVDNSGKFLYVPNTGSQNISAYSINSTTGALTAVVGSPFATPGPVPTAVTIDATNRFLYCTEQFASANEVSTYSINPATGVLKFLRAVEARSQPVAIAMSSGTTPLTYTPRFGYLVNEGDDAISPYTVNPFTGLFSPVSAPFAGGSGVDSLAIDPLGHFVYVSDSGDNGIAGFSFSASDGILFEVPGSPFAARKAPGPIAADPSGRFVYVANRGDLTISAYSIDPSTGSLTQVGSPLATGGEPNDIAIDPSGRFAYVANDDGSNGGISGYTINAATGALSSISGLPFDNPASRYAIAIDASGRFAYATDAGGSVNAYAINPASGALTQISGSPFPVGSVPLYLATDPLGRFVYVANQGSETDQGSGISGYSINPSTGALTSIPGSLFGPGTRCHYISIDPSGRFAYVTDVPDNNFAIYTINASTGALTVVPGSPFATDPSPAWVAITGIIH
jgi:6-phosphogluconolactonase (cycloisomerase 2 family)